VDWGGFAKRWNGGLLKGALMAGLSVKDQGYLQTIQDPSVREALQKGLESRRPGRPLTHAAVVEVICSTLDHGAITTKEQKDLYTVFKSMNDYLEPRSKGLLFSLLKDPSMTSGAKPSTFFIPQEKDANDKLCAFLKRNGKGAFKYLDRDEVGIGLLMRLHKPALIDQGPSSLCGPSVLLFNVAHDQPLAYVTFAIDLYEEGRGKIGKLDIEPSDDCLEYPPPRKKIHAVDWMTAASIRDSENAFFDYQSVDDTLAGITMPAGLAEWLEKAGYQDVRDNTNVASSKTSKTVDEVNGLYDKSYRVCLFINANMLEEDDQTSSSTFPDHWVVLRSEIRRSGKNVEMEVYSWGEGDRTIPRKRSKPLAEADFLNNFYGYVAAKPF
jgi:hypothetical protein